ncbi:MAG: WbqC family protein [Candidatus Aminicenantes bacterium]|jgi:hypothetical protein
MRICYNQPGFIPWGGFFARLIHSDKMVLLDDTLLARGFNYVNRNRIKGPSGEVWISVPIKRKGRGRQKIKDLEIYGKKRWAKDFCLTLQHFYAQSLYLDPIHSEIKTIVEKQEESFISMVISLLTILKEKFNIEKEFLLQSEIGIAAKGSELLASIAKELGANEILMPYFSRKIVDWAPFQKENIRVHFLRYDPSQYPQFWGDFLKRLSALDLFLCCGPMGRRVIEEGSSLYEEK